MPKVVDHEQRRTEVAAAARSAIADRGLDGATVRDIAAAAGVSTGVLAHYFRDKDELLLQALRDSYAAAAGRMLRAGRRNPGLEAVRGMLEEELPLDDAGRTELRVWLAFWGRAAFNPALADEQAAGCRVWRKLIEEAIRVGIEDGSVRADAEPAEEAEALMAFVDGLGLQATLEPGRLPAERQRELLDLQLRRLRPG